jgi:hypothetical protein
LELSTTSKGPRFGENGEVWGVWGTATLGGVSGSIAIDADALSVAADSTGMLSKRFGGGGEASGGSTTADVGPAAAKCVGGSKPTASVTPG